ncbi:YafY family protein [Balneolaceae bacterium ANBcel3]|nr:YafY family protein [Balneolaceae bacterium ANBcel3]
MALITLLQSRSYVPMVEIMKRFSVSERTVFRDLSALQEAGIPIGHDPGKGYFIVPGYLLPPVLFSHEESAALVSAGFFLKEWGNTSTGRAYQSALEKIKSVLKQKEKEFISSLEQQMGYIQWPDVTALHPDPDIFLFLQQAIVRRHVLTLSYCRMDEKKTRRDVEPLGLIMIGESWYLAAWCRLRRDYRIFKIERIKAYSDTNVTFPSENGHSLAEFYEVAKPDNKSFVTIKAFISSRIVPHIESSKRYYGWQSEKEVNGGKEMTFKTYAPDAFCRWIIAWGSSAKVLEPASVKDCLKVLAGEIREYYEKH